MTRVLVRAYAELNDVLSEPRRQRTFDVEFEGNRVGDLLAALGVPAALVDAVLVERRAADLATRLWDGARVALYPVFEALDVSGFQRLRRRPLRAPRFSVGPELTAIAIRLRRLGFDVTCGEPSAVDARPGGRLVLLAPTSAPVMGATHAVRLASAPARSAVRDLIARLHLESQVAPGTRCPRCNAAFAAEDRCRRCGRRRPRAPVSSAGD